jgi:P27 family predicted phage terminase small subunit
MRGRKPIPTDIHKLMGTFRANVQGRARVGEPKVDAELPPEPPATLTPSQAVIWRHAVENAPKGVLKAIDLSLFLGWITAFDEHERARMAQAKLDARGGDLDFLMKNKAGDMILSPYLAVTDRCARRMAKLASELGFTPTARPRLSTGKADDEPEGEGWSRLQVIQGGRE